MTTTHDLAARAEDGEAAAAHEPRSRRAGTPDPRRRGTWATSALGIIGELLITLGVLLGLYVVWQVWWTSVEANQESDRAIASITQGMAPPVVEVAPESRIHGPDEAPPIVDPDARGGLGILHVPVWGENYAAPVLQGTSEAVLATGGAGHYEETALPGDIGNSSLAGHRLTRGNPFLHIDALDQGDAVVVETAQAWLVYTVVSAEIVSPTDVGVILPVPNEPGVEPTERMLTLTTCHPVTSRTHRWITHLTLSHWTERDAGVPPELAGTAQADTNRNNRVDIEGSN